MRRKPPPAIHPVYEREGRSGINRRVIREEAAPRTIGVLYEKGSSKASGINT
jgi:hypothetical protein